MERELTTTVINDALRQTAACGGSVTYDKANGLVFVSYLTGLPRRYGESTGKLCLSVFPPAQPTNILHRTVDTGVGESRGLLSTALYTVGSARVRMIFTTTKGELAGYCRDYDFESDAITERREVFFETAAGRFPLNNSGYRSVLAAFGRTVESNAAPIVNKVTTYQGELYTAVTLDDRSSPILCKIEDNLLIPFAVAADETTYEFRYFRNDDGIFAVFRVPPDDHGTGHAGYTVSKDGGKTWETSVFEDGVQSRPDIMEYYGKPLIVYNYKSGRSSENFPPMHNHRNAIRMIRDGQVLFDYFSKYGIVEHETISIAGDLYMIFTNCPQALSTENGAAWIEDGRPVEQGKEAMQWAKIGYLVIS